MNSLLSICIPATELAVIDRAAAIDQRSRAEFIRAAALNAAQEVLLDRKPLHLNAQAFDQFAAAMAGPAAVSEPVSFSIFAAPYAVTDGFSSGRMHGDLL